MINIDKNLIFKKHLNKLTKIEVDIYTEYKNIFNKFFPDNFSEEQLDSLNEFLKSFQYLDEKLKPFKNAGLNYELALAGGAIRDLFLGKPISDLDMIVSFCNKKIIKGNNYVSYEITEDLWKQILGDKFDEAEYVKICHYAQQNLHLLSIDGEIQNEPRIDNYKIAYLCSKLFGDVEKQKDINLTNCLENEYLNDLMIDNIKIKVPGLKFQIDFVLSRLEPDFYMRNFDFSLCKCILNYNKTNINNEYIKLNNKSIEDLCQNIFLPPQCLYDWERKTMTLNAKDFSEDHVEYFLSKHFVKMQKKFPDYTLNIINNDVLKIKYMKLELENNLTEKIKVPKIKI